MSNSKSPQGLSMQLYLRQPAEEAKLIDLVRRVTGMRLACLDAAIDEDADGIFQISWFTSGFIMGFSIAWSAKVNPSCDRLQLAKVLSAQLGTDVATDLPGISDPYTWCLVEPDGRIYAISEDIEKTECNGSLILDESTRRLLNTSE